MKIIFLLLIVPIISYAGGKDIIVPDYMQTHKVYISMKCIDEKTQHEMDECGERSLKSAASNMESMLAKLIKNHTTSEPELSIALKTSQTSWKIYMEDSCKVETYDSRDGSAFHAIWNACLEIKINERISYLSWMMENP